MLYLSTLPFLLVETSPPLQDPAILNPAFTETSTYRACLDKAKYDVNAINLCNVDEYNRWYRVLDLFVSQAIKTAPLKMRLRLQMRHKFWNKEMWKRCGSTQTIDFERGTAERMESSFCILESVEKRVKWVKVHWLDRAKTR